VTFGADMARRHAVLAAINDRLDEYNRSEDIATGRWSTALPIESLAAATDAQRVQQLEGLLKTIRVGVLESGEASPDLVLAMAAQAAAFLCAVDERSECRVVG
jgi:hypothetical protein